MTVHGQERQGVHRRPRQAQPGHGHAEHRPERVGARRRPHRPRRRRRLGRARRRRGRRRRRRRRRARQGHAGVDRRGAKVKAERDVRVQAFSQETVVSVAAAGGGGFNAGIAGAVEHLRGRHHHQGLSASDAARGIVAAPTATSRSPPSRRTELDFIAGNLAVGGTAGIGGAVIVPVDHQEHGRLDRRRRAGRRARGEGRRHRRPHRRVRRHASAPTTRPTAARLKPPRRLDHRRQRRPAASTAAPDATDARARARASPASPSPRSTRTTSASTASAPASRAPSRSRSPPPCT